MIWKQVPSYPFLEVSDTGLIRNIKTGTTYKVSKDKNGYVRMHTELDGRNINLFVHRLVCEAFHGVSSDTVDHINKIRTDNSPSNLRWLDSFTNNSIGHLGMKHSAATKELFSEQRTAEKHPRTTLSNAQVAEIKMKLNMGILCKNLAKEYRVNECVIRCISSGVNWSTVKARNMKP
jgi:hypothetical protein